MEDYTVKKILLVRTDRIGDVVLSLPMLPMLKRKYPSAKISVMVRPYTKELVDGHSNVDEVILWDETHTFAEYVSRLRRQRFDVAIVPYPRFRIALLLFLSGILTRVGTGYRWYSFLFTHRVFEHRKDAQRHEAEYNLNLLTAIGIDRISRPEFEFRIPPEAEQTVARMLAAEKVERFAVLHAGSGGSARDWSPEKFAQLGDALSRQLGLSVVLTGGNNESDLVRSVAEKMERPPVNVCGKFSLKELGALFRRAAVFVSNSTGPLHIAAMCGTPVAAFYPPIVQCSPVRWGPFTEKKKIFTADNRVCPLCTGGACRSSVCMDQITVEQVVAGIQELLHDQ